MSIGIPASQLLENCLEVIANLPDDLQDHFLMIFEEDTRFEASRKLLLKKRSALLKQVEQKPDAQEEILNTRRKIEKETRRAASYIDEKIVLTEKLSKMIGSYNKMLEEALCAISADDTNSEYYGYGSDYKEFTSDYYTSEKEKGSERGTHSVESNRTSHTAYRKSAANAAPASEKSSYSPISPAATHHPPASGRLSGRSSPSNLAGTDSNSTLTDQLVYGSTADLQEPVYCFCRQVSYGDMIGCDNPQCVIEWFHYQCVGLSAPPRGKWYCPDCAPKFK